MTRPTSPARSTEGGPVSAGELAALLGGRLEGDPEVRVLGVAAPGVADEGCAVCLFSKKGFGDLPGSSCTLLVIPDQESAVSDARAAKPDAALLAVPDAEAAFAALLDIFHPPSHPFSGISPAAVVEAGAVLGEGVAVAPLAYVSSGALVGARSVLYPHVYVGPGVRIGEDCVLRPGAVVERGCVLGDRVILQPGAIVGGDGFGYLRRGGTYRKKQHAGKVVLGDDVEVGSNATIDRAVIGETIVGRGTKIDNLVQVAHNVTLGENVILVAQVGIAGSSTVGDGSILAGQAGVGDHLSVGSGVVAGARAGITRDVPDGASVHGFPAVDARQWLRQSLLIQSLPELKRRVAELEARLREMEGRSGGL